MAAEFVACELGSPQSHVGEGELEEGELLDSDEESARKECRKISPPVSKSRKVPPLDARSKVGPLIPAMAPNDGVKLVEQPRVPLKPTGEVEATAVIPNEGIENQFEDVDLDELELRRIALESLSQKIEEESTANPTNDSVLDVPKKVRKERKARLKKQNVKTPPKRGIVASEILAIQDPNKRIEKFMEIVQKPPNEATKKARTGVSEVLLIDDHKRQCEVFIEKVGSGNQKKRQASVDLVDNYDPVEMELEDLSGKAVQEDVPEPVIQVKSQPEEPTPKSAVPEPKKAGVKPTEDLELLNLRTDSILSMIRKQVEKVKTDLDQRKSTTLKSTGVKKQQSVPSVLPVPSAAPATTLQMKRDLLKKDLLKKAQSVQAASKPSSDQQSVFKWATQNAAAQSNMYRLRRPNPNMTEEQIKRLGEILVINVESSSDDDDDEDDDEQSSSHGNSPLPPLPILTPVVQDVQSTLKTKLDGLQTALKSQIDQNRQECVDYKQLRVQAKQRRQAWTEADSKVKKLTEQLLGAKKARKASLVSLNETVDQCKSLSVRLRQNIEKEKQLRNEAIEAGQKIVGRHFNLPASLQPQDYLKLIPQRENGSRVYSALQLRLQELKQRRLCTMTTPVAPTAGDRIVLEQASPPASLSKPQLEKLPSAPLNCDSSVDATATLQICLQLMDGRTQMKELLVKSLHSQKKSTAAAVEIPVQAFFPPANGSQSKLHRPYQSVLNHFRGYRFSPYFKGSRTMLRLDPRRPLCRFDLTGTCNDTLCKGQHWDRIAPSEKELLCDIASYSPEVVGVVKSHESSSKQIDKFVSQFMERRRGTSFLQIASELSSLVQAKRKAPYWMPLDQMLLRTSHAASIEVRKKEHSGAKESLLYTEETRRYFDHEEPGDLVALAYIKLRDESLEMALDVLSRGIETDRHNVRYWQHYLRLLERRTNSEEMVDMCRQAIRHAPSYEAYFKCMVHESNLTKKTRLCEDIVKYLESSALPPNLLSACLSEITLVKVNLLVQAKGANFALITLRRSLFRDNLLPTDHALLWTCFIYLEAFGQFPESIWADNRAFMLIQRQLRIKFDELPVKADHIRRIFLEALESCPEAEMNILPNFCSLERLRDNRGLVSNIRKRLQATPDYEEIWSLLLGLLSSPDDVVSTYEQSTTPLPRSWRLLFETACVLRKQERVQQGIQILGQFVRKIAPDDSRDELTLLRALLWLDPCLNIPRLPSDAADPFAWLCLGLLLGLSGAPISALAEPYERALAATPEHRCLILTHYVSAMSAHSGILADILKRTVNEDLPGIAQPELSGRSVNSELISLILDSGNVGILYPLVPDNCTMWRRIWPSALNNETLRRWAVIALRNHPPRDLPFWQTIVDSLIGEDQLDQARSLLRQALKLFPHTSQLWEKLLHLEILLSGDAEELQSSVTQLMAECHKLGLKLKISASVSMKQI